jgi:UDP-glucose 4-epimerase
VRVVVTGGAGFIGANLSGALMRRGHEVVAFDNLTTGAAHNLSGLDDVRLVVADVRDPSALGRELRGADAVVHLAALPSVPRSLADPNATHDVNATGTLNVLEACRTGGVGHVLVASSSSVYGANPTLPKHEALAPEPVSPYAASKLATESYALAWQRSFGIDALALRFFNVFGPLQAAGHAYAAVVPVFIDAARAGRPLPVHGDGTQSRDFTFVGSVAKVLSDAVERRVSSPGPVNLAFGTRATLLDVIETLESLLGRALERDFQPSRLGDVRHSQADTARLRSLFPDAAPVPLEVGLAATIEWFEAAASGT